MGRLLVVTSGKGGVGKSTVAAGLGCALARRGNAVLLLDMDEGLRCLDSMLGLSERTVFDLGDVLTGSRPVTDALLPVPGYERFSLLAAPLRAGVIQREAVEKLTGSLVGRYDSLILDCPAGIDRGFRFSVPPGSQALVVVNPEPVSVRDAAVVDGILEEMGISPRLMVLNKLEKKRMKKGCFPTVDSVMDLSGLRLAAIVPYDETVAESAAKGEPLDKGRAARAFDRLAARLEGEEAPLPPMRKI